MSSLPGDLQFRSIENGSRSMRLIQINLEPAMSSHAAAANTWRGNVGVVTTMIPRAPFDPSNTVALVCGPEVMMRFAAMGLQKRGVPGDHINLSMERNMKCGIGLCGHCQYGPIFTCKHGPVLRFDRIAGMLNRAEI